MADAEKEEPSRLLDAEADDESPDLELTDEPTSEE